MCWVTPSCVAEFPVRARSLASPRSCAAGALAAATSPFPVTSSRLCSGWANPPYPPAVTQGGCHLRVKPWEKFLEYVVNPLRSLCRSLLRSSPGLCKPSRCSKPWNFTAGHIPAGALLPALALGWRSFPALAAHVGLTRPRCERVPCYGCAVGAGFVSHRWPAHRS